MGISGRNYQFIGAGHVATIVGAAFMTPTVWARFIAPARRRVPVRHQMHVGVVNAAPTLHVLLLSQFMIELERLWIA
jgi:hypothetical protein